MYPQMRNPKYKENKEGYKRAAEELRCVDERLTQIEHESRLKVTVNYVGNIH